MPSTVIRNAQYDPATRILSVWFVPSGNAAFTKASSKGRFFNEFIRDRHRYRRVA
ncbi:KTSC domain-containing protein [Mesorhizobium sp. M7A.F.Ca.ET.027.03.2.1]|uniref:KTSC domain-containing protein n=1 Tax=Mesorhizobium sp. M7A.F.Ca.ET.027.03.2.1 TaxID=2496656 RepID=UPI000FCC0B3C|nr:KTSC domain-containing protein [Mesorhizobium sp. M7A.F.Ca.ET.027.03.2.1]RVD65680.1 KTSC domain-containing protein [Mesorhizobium sp. M7A.F.Ca.ET.027.03.2.1]